MVRDAGAKEVHVRISCPPTISPCYYGVDTPSKGQLIASNKSMEEIRDYIGADSLAYLSLEGLREACAEGEKTTYCTSCYTGVYPTDFIPVDQIQPVAVAKKHVGFALPSLEMEASIFGENTCYLIDPDDMLKAAQRGDIDKVRQLLSADSTLVNARGAHENPVALGRGEELSRWRNY